jgi:nicotinamide-nucleotide amidase
MISASVITIGDEILYGQTLDTNAHFISQRISTEGYKVILRLSVGDKASDIIDALKTAESKTEIILVTGGLGPTRDDITKKTLSVFFESDLELNQEALEDLTAYFNKRGLQLTEVNRMQAILPRGCRIIKNPVGTAPGMWFEKENKVFASMPGVPHEMENMLVNGVIPLIRQKYRPPVIYHKMIMTAGIGESWLSDKIGKWENDLPSYMKLAYLPGFGQVKLRLTSHGQKREVLENETEEQVEKLKEMISSYIYGYDDITLEERIGEILRGKKKKIAVAESCTGGHLSHHITSISGSSDYFTGSIIAYSNRIKEKILGVNPEILSLYGAVSEETVKEMASNIKKLFSTDIGLATTGIAGPGGGSVEKPVGLVWIAIADDYGVESRKFTYAKDRVTNIQFATIGALTFLWQRLTKSS